MDKIEIVKGYLESENDDYDFKDTISGGQIKAKVMEINRKLSQRN